MTLRKISIGEKYSTKHCGDLIVIDVVNTNNVVVEFVNTGFKTISTTGNIFKGHVKDRLKPSVAGFGFIGCGGFKCSVNGTKTQSYTAWVNILNRCFNKERQKKQPTYTTCTISEDWLNYQNFAKWFSEQKERIAFDDSLQVDKDLLSVGNKHYSDKTCVLVPRWLNSFVLDHAAARGEQPIGVCYVKATGRYRAYCNDKGRRVEFGQYSDKNAAHVAWKKYKLSLALERKPEMDMIDKRIYPNVVNIINNAK